MSSAHELENFISQTESQLHTKIRDNIALKHKLEGECLTKYWINANKERTPRDTIHELRVQAPVTNSEEPQYIKRSDNMAELAKEYHENLQKEGLGDPPRPEQLEPVLSSLETKLTNQQKSSLARYITEAEVNEAIKNLPTGKAPGLDGIPHELWKKLAKRYHDDLKAKRDPVNITKILQCVFNDIERNGVDETTDFSAGWMCPIYKKGDIREISNYRPITVLNSDYKIMTRVLTTRLSKVVPSLIHEDQAGFMKGRRIEDQTDLVRLMIDKCEAYSENGAIVCLDQEKAYDKIKHNFIWETLSRMNFPSHFMETLRTLYKNGKTCVIINGVTSDFYNVVRGVRQGDPLSCLIFNLAIESLAAMIRQSNLKGFEIPGQTENLITTLFADDTTVYLSEEDKYETLIQILKTWCDISGAKFNTSKTVVIPVGTPEYRERVIETRQISETQARLPEGIKVAADGEAVRVLGAHVGNKTNQEGIWVPTIEKLERRLNQWLKGHPTQNGKRLVVAMEVGGLTQYLTRVQGMPKTTEELISRKVSKFFWNGELPTVNYATLTRPIEEGGKHLLDVEARNDAIDLVRLKTYLRDNPKRPRWAYIADALIKKHVSHHPHKVHDMSVKNFILQSWKTKSRKIGSFPESLKRLIKIAKKYKARPGDTQPTETLLGNMPIWHHIGFKQNERPRNNDVWADCQRTNHKIMTVAEMTQYTEAPDVDGHDETARCVCVQCENSRTMGCLNPQKCKEAGKKTIEMLYPKWNPKKQGESEGAYVREEQEFNKNAPQSDSPLDSVRVFQALNDDTLQPAATQHTQLNQDDETEVFINSLVQRRNQQSEVAKAGIFFRTLDERNGMVQAPGPVITRQAAEITAIKYIIRSIGMDTNLRLHFPTTSTPNLLLRGIKSWEEKGWLTHKNGAEIQGLVRELRQRKGKTLLVPPEPEHHKEEQTEAYLIAEGANEPKEVPAEHPRANTQGRETTALSGAKLSTMTQSKLYRAIMKWKKPPRERRAATKHLDMIRHAVFEITGELPSDSAIWRRINDKVYTHRHKAFIWRAIHDSYKVGEYWDTIPTLEQRGICSECNVPETLNHILTECRASGQETIWSEAERVWNLRAPPEWRKPTLGAILGSNIPQLREGNRNEGPVLKGASRLRTILISESAQLIWRIRCKWRITNNSDPQKIEGAEVLRKTWKTQMNRRMYLEILQTNTYKYGRKALNSSLVDRTWRSVLENSVHVRDEWMNNMGGLVGIG